MSTLFGAIDLRLDLRLIRTTVICTHLNTLRDIMAAPDHQTASFNSLPTETVREIFTRLPRKSKTAILTMSLEWNTRATNDLFLWTDLVFGPKAQEADLIPAQKWITRSGSMPLSVTISRDPSQIDGSDPSVIRLFRIIHTLLPLVKRIKVLHIDGPHTNTEIIWPLLSLGYSFPRLQTLAIILEAHFNTIVQHGAPTVATLSTHPAIFLPIDSPSLRSLHLSNFPAIWPAPAPSVTSILLQDLVLGQISEHSPSLLEPKQALESAPLLKRLGFYHQLESLSLYFSALGLQHHYWEALTATGSESGGGGVISLPGLLTLTLLDVPPVLAQQLVFLRAHSKQRKLRTLELLLTDNEARNANTIQWSAWLRKHVDELSIVNICRLSSHKLKRGVFEI
ncbi:hypothetical protein C8R45DRAFT_1128088 [Mycena sanguinolenta]|nr:hypothetical protein C8R45DRAFT_1128088 [Mycena sanguinolenta]